ncbi:MAG: flagellar export protein FliJ [Bdellovibrionales bacterium]
MAFRFGLEAVLKYRKRLEEIAQKDFAEAQAAAGACLREIESMYQRMDEVREEIRRAAEIGTAQKLEEIRAMEQFLEGQKIRVERQRLKARELMAVAEEKQEALTAAVREKKVLVKLKEKRLNEHREWIARVEAKTLDDLTMVREARRRR